jgi:hypothetical protein
MIEALFVDELIDHPGKTCSKANQDQRVELSDEIRLHVGKFYSRRSAASVLAKLRSVLAGGNLYNQGSEARHPQFEIYN